MTYSNRRSNNKSPSGFTNLPPNFKQRLYYTKIHTLPELMLFLHQLPALLISQPKVSKTVGPILSLIVFLQISLVVFNSFYFPFQNSNLGLPKMKPLYAKVKETFSQVCASGHLTVNSNHFKEMYIIKFCADCDNLSSID